MGVIEISNLKPFAFVLMPFAQEFKDIYKFGIKETADQLGVVAERVDEQHFSETMLERIYRQIEQCDFIIAEMSGQNPNVFYEVGYAHAKGKLCILVTKSASDIPFDLKHHSHVVYDGSIDDLKTKLTPKIEWLKAEVQSQSTKTISVKASASSGFLDKTNNWTHMGSFDLTLSFKNTTNKRSPEIEAIYLKSKSGWTLSVNGIDCPSEQIDGNEGNLRHFISPPIRRLAPDAFAELSIKWSRTLWSKFDSSGIEASDEYEMKGTLRVEIVTDEGSFNEESSLYVGFDEFPF